MSTNVVDEALFHVISTLSENPLRAVQRFITKKDACDKLQIGNVSATLVNNLGVSCEIPDLIYKKEQHMGDCIAKLETRLSILTDMNAQCQNRRKS